MEALFRFGPAYGPSPAAGDALPQLSPGQSVTVSFTGSVDTPATWPGSRLRLNGTHGAHGALVASGYGSYAVSRISSGGADAAREELPVPRRLVDALPQAGDPLHNKWAALAREFLADVRGEPHQPYLTFRDGWRYQQAIDVLRTGRGWFDVTSALDASND